MTYQKLSNTTRNETPEARQAFFDAIAEMQADKMSTENLPFALDHYEIKRREFYEEQSKSTGQRCEPDTNTTKND